MKLLSKYLMLTAVAVLAVTACGSDDPFCGDKNLDMGEECDDGNDDETDFCLSTCKARQLSQLTVKWAFSKDSAEGFTGDTCIDLGASTVEIELIGGPEPLVLSDRCSFYQAVFVDIPAGDYEVRARVLGRCQAGVDCPGEDPEDVLLTTSVISENFTFDGGTDMKELVIPFDSLTRSYDGDFFFRVAWNATDCALADPVVVEQRLTLVAGGETFTGSTTDGAALDGSAASACVSMENEFPQAALDVPAGPADLRIEGLDGLGEVVFSQDFETFVGAGVANPELIFDVDAVPPPV